MILVIYHRLEGLAKENITICQAIRESRGVDTTPNVVYSVDVM